MEKTVIKKEKEVRLKFADSRTSETFLTEHNVPL
jgi:hypothetical protein